MTNFPWKSAPADRDPGRFMGGMQYLVDGRIETWTGPSIEILSPVFDGAAPRALGPSALLDATTALRALEAARKAYGRGRGWWPTAPVAARIKCVERFLEKMKEKRVEVARLLAWEIGKPWKDSLAEFDRTVEYGYATIEALKELDRVSARFSLDGGFLAQIRRSPVGVNLCMGPYNYPLNETYTTLLPALIMGNAVISKLPRYGILCHAPLLEAFAEAFPPGVVNIISGDGAEVVTPIIESGDIDLLAFIGSARVANILKHKHPKPNRLRCVLGLGAKNPAIVLDDADLDRVVPECISGALSFNGQRCTALKIFLVQRAVADEFAARMAAEVEKLKAGLPFEDGVTLTPLPDVETVKKMSGYLEDAVAKGARVVNPRGGETDRTWFHPAVVYPVTEAMTVWRTEQFGPIVPIAVFDEIDEVFEYLAGSVHGQQASVFGENPAVIGRLIDELVNQVCRVNLNSQCRRGPDTYPFGGRKDSAEGTLSVSDALRVFSIRTLVAAKEDGENTALVQEILRGRQSRFLTTDYLF